MSGLMSRKTRGFEGFVTGCVNHACVQSGVSCLFLIGLCIGINNQKPRVNNVKMDDYWEVITKVLLGVSLVESQ